MELVKWHEILHIKLNAWNSLSPTKYYTIPSFTTSIVELSSAWLFLQKTMRKVLLINTI